jgi:predicted DNA-binding transcriptional regulator AlpA
MSEVVLITLQGVRFQLSLGVIREALVLRSVEEAMTLGEVAQVIGLSRMTLWRLLSGQSVSPQIVGRVLRFLDLDAKEVLRSVQSG